MNSIFLSSSVPDRDPWLGNSDPLTVREAVLALTAVWLPRGELVFGGHPAISPLVEHAARSLGLLDRVHIYQSLYFERDIPEAAKKFVNLHWTATGPDRGTSLTLMRREMLDSSNNRQSFQAAVFIGGMDGIDEELQIFRKAHPSAALIPVGSTGAAALNLWNSGVGLASGKFRNNLLAATRYRELFRTLLY